jgi:hypothetical protein
MPYPESLAALANSTSKTAGRPDPLRSSVSVSRTITAEQCEPRASPDGTIERSKRLTFLPFFGASTKASRKSDQDLLFLAGQHFDL